MSEQEKCVWRRLIGLYHDYEDGRWRQYETTKDILKEAADEIERLRAEIERLTGENIKECARKSGQRERAEAAEQRADQLQAKLDTVAEGYREAIEDIQGWACYASPYFQEKHDLDGCVAGHKAKLEQLLNG